MQIEKIELYKLPIDNEYKNVYLFDNNSLMTKENLYYYIDTIFGSSSYTIYSEGIEQKTRCINENKRTQITFNHKVSTTSKSLEDVYNYNYAIIHFDYTNSKPLFYFIEDFRVNNSVNFDPNITIFLQWDAFSNNIEQFSNNITVDVQRQIVDGFIKTDINEPEKIYPLAYNTNEFEVPLHTRRYRERAFQNSYTSSKLSVLYQRCFWDNDAPVKLRSGALAGITCIPSIAPLKVTYHPIAVVDRVTGKVIPQITTYIAQYQEESSTINVSVDLEYAKNGRVITPDVTFLLFSDLTFQAPFRPTFDIDDGNYPPLFTMSANTYGYVDLGFSGDQFHRNLFGFVSCSYSREISKIVLDDEYIIDTLSELYSFDRLSNIKNIIDQNSRLMTYPYEYKQITIGQQIYPLIPEFTEPSMISSQTRKARTQININNKNSIVSKIKIKNYGKSEEEMEQVFDNNVYMIFRNYGQCVVVQNRLEHFLRENESSVNTNMALSSIRGALSALSAAQSQNIIGTVSGFVGAMAPSMQLEAKIEDINRSQDIITIPVSNAADDLTRQDNIMFQKVQISDYRNKERLARFFHAYGINIDAFSTLILRSRKNFGFTSTKNVSLTNITNIEDRKILENAFNRGIRYYYIDSAPQNIIRTLDLTIPNKPKSWIV